MITKKKINDLNHNKLLFFNTVTHILSLIKLNNSH